MAVSTSARPESLWGVSRGSLWLSTEKASAASGVGTGFEAQGWNDAYMAAVLFHIECNDAYVAAFLLNLRGSGQA
jgi:hypothetical protein